MLNFACPFRKQLFIQSWPETFDSNRFMQLALSLVPTATQDFKISVCHVVLFAEVTSFQVIFNFRLTLFVTGSMLFNSFIQVSFSITDVAIGTWIAHALKIIYNIGRKIRRRITFKIKIRFYFKSRKNNANFNWEITRDTMRNILGKIHRTFTQVGNSKNYKR